jgi:glucose-6-phosphate dehydrogenase assembly protein OpcA
MADVDGTATAGFAGLKPVRVGDVENELGRRIDSGSRAGTTVSRACSLNLIVFIENAADAQAVSQLLDRIAGAHPIRVIEVMLDPKTPETDVRAWIDLECGEEVAGSLLCSEQIKLVASPDSSARLVSAVTALLSPDLPVALWWRGGSPFLSRSFKGLVPLADKIVVDSKRFGDGPAALDTLHRLNGLRGGRMALSDMNWHRIATWRTTLAACFDDPVVLTMLPEFDRSEIEFSLGPKAADAPPSARSLLLAGWIVSRLPAIAGHGDIRGSQSDWATPGSIVGLRLRSSASRAAVAISWQSIGEGISATAFDRGGAPLRRWRFSPDPEGEADLLARCIDSVSADPLLDTALEVG